MTDKIELPKIVGVDPDTEKEILAIFYALELIRRATGHGTIIVAISNGKAVEMTAQHEIRPKYINPT